MSRQEINDTRVNDTRVEVFAWVASDRPSTGEEGMCRTLLQHPGRNLK